MRRSPRPADHSTGPKRGGGKRTVKHPRRFVTRSFTCLLAGPASGRPLPKISPPKSTHIVPDAVELGMATLGERIHQALYLACANKKGASPCPTAAHQSTKAKSPRERPKGGFFRLNPQGFETRAKESPGAAAGISNPSGRHASASCLSVVVHPANSQTRERGRAPPPPIVVAAMKRNPRSRAPPWLARSI